MEGSPEARLRDAREYAEIAIRFMDGQALETYLLDQGLNLIIERAIEVIGEALNAARKMEPGLEEAIPDLRVAVAVRNRIVHTYNKIDHVILHETVRVSLPRLVDQINQVLARRET
jgi:uncharacterized protein with HEPN domain